jgi:hypothetical protein
VTVPPASTRLRLRVTDPSREPAAADAAAALPGAGIFHTAAWAGVLHRAYGFQTRMLLAEDPLGAVMAAVPVTTLRRWPRRPRAVSQPYADECGVAGRTPESCDFVYSASREHALRAGCLHWELRGAGAPAGTAASTVFFGHRLQLEPAESGCPAAAAPSVRRAIRQAERAGVSVEFGSGEELLRRFHALYQQTRRRHGAPPAPWRFFGALRSEVLAKGNGFTAVATRAGEDLAGAVFLISGATALYKYGASNPAHHHLRPNHLVMARAAGRCARAGCTTLDFGRTAPRAEGLRRYKLSWGAIERLVTYTRIDPADGRVLPAPDRSGGRAAALMRLLPRPLFRALGAALHPHLA